MTTLEPSADRRSLLQSSLQALEAMEAKLAAVEQARTEPIAVIGMSCRFPGGVDSPESFWKLLCEGHDAVSELPADRMRIVTSVGYHPTEDPTKPVWRGGFLDHIDQFDPQLFGITPREAVTMDPQQRLVLEVAWEALEHAGCAPDSLSGSLVGMFLGISTNDYGDIVRLQGYENIDAYAATGGSMNVAAGRVSFTLGLQGPALAVDTACSSSLVAVHLAVQSLRINECNLALAGGVNVVLMPDGFVSFSSWGMMASDGHCKAFDARADGFVRSEGCGILVLKRLSNAVADGDSILAVIRGSAVNQDGRSSGLTVPNGRAQQAMLRQALANAGLEPNQVQYIEAHGTGTALGDPIEVEAIGTVLGEGRGPDQPLFLSSVKTNIGHAESAAGIAAVIKAILAIQHGEIPPMLHLQERNPNIPWPAFPVELPTTPTPWPARAGERIVGVSGFGFSGTNAHVILASPPARTPRPGLAAEIGRPRIVTLSAKSEEALRAAAARLARHLDAHPEQELGNVAFTANTGRAQFAHRLAVVAAEREELATRLRTFANGEPGPAAFSGRARSTAPKVAFLFTGQGAQYPQMGRDLYAREPVFSAALDRCAQLIAPHLDVPLLDLIVGEAADRLDQTTYTQPALFALEYALSELWRSWGVNPSVVIGHSVGEYVAAVVAGVMTLEDGLRLIAARGRLMGALPAGGAMAAIFAPLEQVQAAVAPYAADLAIAAINGPEHIVISGAVAAVKAVSEPFASAGIRVQQLTVSHAFHSPLMDALLDSFEQVAAGITMRPPRLPLVSNLTGELASNTVTSPGYWRRHLREAVRFADGLKTVRGLGAEVLLELGPHPVLLGMAQQLWSGDAALPALPSLRRNKDGQQQILESLGQLYVGGAAIPWAALHQGESRRKLNLPTYPFQRARYWVDLPRPGARKTGATTHAGHPLLGNPTRSPLVHETIFSGVVSADDPPYLADHRVYGATVFPGTAYLELALAAAASVNQPPLSVVNLSISEPLLLEATPRMLQLVLGPESEGERSLQIVSCHPETVAEVQFHAMGSVSSGGAPEAPAGADLAALQADCPEPVDVISFYEELATRGLDYGPAFRGVTELWRRDGAALGLVRLPSEAGSATGYQLHPALLDACFHVIGAALPAGDIGVPVGIAGLHLFAPAPQAVWCYAERIAAGTDDQNLTCRLLLLDQAGQPVAQLDRLEILRVPRGAWARDALSPWFHQLAWHPQPRATAPTGTAGSWLVLADATPTADILAARLAAAGADVTIALTDQVSAGPDTDQRRIEVSDPAAFDTLLTGKLHGVVCLWEAPPPPLGLTAAALAARQAQATRATLQVVQALARRSGAQPRLWIVTRGTQAVDELGAPVEPADAALWGLGRVVALEHPDLHCGLIDLDPLSSNIDQLTAELLAPDDENQLAFRGETRLVARLVPQKAPLMALPVGVPYRLTLPARGMLDKLTFAPLEAREPGPGEVAVMVHATGLNFRDVLNVLGMYPGDPGPPGIECAGVVTAVGSGVSGIAVGDAVVGLAPNSFDARVITPANLVAHKPTRLSFAEAATIPSAFLTAYYGLQTLAGLKPGERVLIHAAAGGVGLAAVQIAQQLGAEVFATAGSATKQAYLRSLGVRHIFSSRQATFRDQIAVISDGHGIDVVLNSLSDDFISDSFAALAPNGRFLEIGKRGIWSLEQAAQARPDVRYYPYDLGDVLRDQPELIKAMLEELLAAMAEGVMTPLPLRAFAAPFAVDAFRYMSQARHIGKVVVTHAPASWLGPARAEGTYLITGGLGGLGLKVAAWLVERGARHLTLVGRRAPSQAATMVLEDLRAVGAEILILAADVAQTADVDRIMAAITATGQPLRGVFHAAGALDDGVLIQQRWERFEAIFAPKLVGAWNLHLATRSASLDYFVLFSSASALLGNVGQANYAAANTFLDALAHRRRAEGLPALSINWGAWGEVGMAAALATEHQGQMAGRGVELIDPEKGVLALEQALTGGAAQVAVLPVRWATLLEQFPEGQVPPLFAELARVTAIRPVRTTRVTDDGLAFRKALAAATLEQRQQLLVERLTIHVAQVMGINHKTTDPNQSLSDLGIDSLMAVELKNRIDGDLRGSLPVTALLAGPTIVELATQLADQHGGTTVNEQQQQAEDGASNGHTPADLLANLDQLSDSDVDALLTAMLKDKERT